jgi:integrase/recombinase XerD
MKGPRLIPGLKWRDGTIHADFVWKGQRVRKALGTGDPQLAEVMLGEMKSNLFRGTTTAATMGPARMTVARAFDHAAASEWLAGARANTVKSAHHHFARLTQGDKPLVPVTTPVADLDRTRLVAIRRALLDEGLSPGTVNLRMWVLRAILDAAKAAGAIPSVPEMPKALPTRARRRMRYLTPAEEKLVLEYLGTDDRYLDLKDLWVVMLDTGMRVNEVATLRSTDVDLRLRTLRVRPEVDKAKRGRHVPMTERVVGIVQRRASVSERLFPTESTDPRYWVARFGDLWREARADLGLGDVVLHTGRHTTGTRLFEAGMDLRTAMEYLGHSTPEMTLGYAKAVASKLHAAARSLETLARGEQAAPSGTAREPHGTPETAVDCGPTGIQPSTGPSSERGPEDPDPSRPGDNS